MLLNYKSKENKRVIDPIVLQVGSCLFPTKYYHDYVKGSVIILIVRYDP